jgi:hypothetical protein
MEVLLKVAVGLLFSIVPNSMSASGLPTQLFTELSERIQATFFEINEVRILPDGGNRVEILVIGSARVANHGWIVQIFSPRENHLIVKWDSKVLRNRLEFEMSGPAAMSVNVVDGHYYFTLSACAQHACYDGVLGYLMYDGMTGKMWTAKLTTIDDDAHGGTLRYDVSWLPDNDTSVEGLDARQVLEHNICQSTRLSDPSKLPFHCSSGGPSSMSNK